MADIMEDETGFNSMSDFDFKSSKISAPPTISQLSTGNQASFYIKPNNNIYPKDPCEKQQINNIPNLNIVGKPGRQFGQTVLYDPVQQQNYVSQYSAYEKSLRYAPSGITQNTQDSNGGTAYSYCSGNSPTGFWQVTVSGGGTYLNFGTPVLTIICPRPFAVQDLTTVDTDGTDITWTQQQGRYTVISPSSGDGSLNPDLFIIGNRTPVDPPILILAQLTDNPLAFDYLVIKTTIADEVDGLSGMESAILSNSGPSFAIPCVFNFTPGTPNTAFQWTNQNVGITWNPPPTTGGLVEYRIQQNMGGAYVTISSVPPTGDRIFTLQKEQYYRILTIYNILGGGYSATDSCRISVADFVPIFADDAIDGLSGMDGAFISRQYPLSVIQAPLSTDILDGLSGMDGAFISRQYPLSVIQAPLSTDILDGLSGMDGAFTATNYNLAGAIVG